MVFTGKIYILLVVLLKIIIPIVLIARILIVKKRENPNE